MKTKHFKIVLFFSLLTDNNQMAAPIAQYGCEAENTKTASVALYQKGHFLTFWRAKAGVGCSDQHPLEWSAPIGVVSVENSLCSIILMAVSNCIMPEQQVALAAGVEALMGSPHWPRVFGQGSWVRALSGHRIGSWPMGRAGQWWSDEWFIDVPDEENAKRLHLNVTSVFLQVSKDTICSCFTYSPTQTLYLNILIWASSF